MLAHARIGANVPEPRGLLSIQPTRETRKASNEGIVNSGEGRATAARQVIRDDPDVDRLYLLSLVIWPTPSLTAAPPVRRGVSPEEVARMVELDNGTRSHREIGELVGRPRPTVSEALRRHAASPVAAAA